MPSRRTCLTLAATLALAPLALAHTDQGGPGTPNHHCQTPVEWAVHDYASPNRYRLTGVSDNNLEECVATYGGTQGGTPECRELVDRFGMGPGNPVWELLCHTDRPGNFDGDYEFALGGALLAVEDGDGATSGSIVCLGMIGHHGITIDIYDQIFGDNVAFSVGADASLPGAVLPGEPDCGDGVVQPCGSPFPGFATAPDVLYAPGAACNPDDHLVQCWDVCTVPFGPGANGTYVIWVYATTNGGPRGEPTGASLGHIVA